MCLDEAVWTIFHRQTISKRPIANLPEKLLYINLDIRNIDNPG